MQSMLQEATRLLSPVMCSCENKEMVEKLDGMNIDDPKQEGKD